MSFWSTVGNAAKGAVDKSREINAEAEALVADYRSENDDWLKSKLRNGNVAQKMAATMVLKERGYGS